MTEPADRAGLQPERTALAWQRTAITATVVMVPLVVVSARHGSWLLTVLASVATAAAGLLVIGVQRRSAQLRDEQRPFSPVGLMTGVAAVTSLAAALGLATALVLALG